MKEVSFILVPGLNDRKPLFRWFYSELCNHWNRAGMDCVVAPIDWEDDDTFAAKKERLALLITAKQKRGRRVVLVGVSAGASLVIATYGSQPKGILAVVSIGGLLALAHEPHEVAYSNRSWYVAAKTCEKVIAKMTAAQKQKVLTFSPLRDSVIDPARQKIKGVRNRRLPSIGHVTSIAFCLLTRRRTIRRFVANLLKKSH